MLRAVIFDFDGTIADTIPAITEGINLTMTQYSYPTHTDEEVLTYINNGPRMLIRRALPKELQQDEKLLDRVLADYDSLYQTVCAHTNKPYDGLEEVVRTLRERNIKIGVLSNKQDRLLGQMIENVLPNMIDATQGSLPNQPTKPDPYLTSLITEKLGVTPAECVMIGDSDVDVKTAQEACMHHIGVSWGYRNEAFLRQSGATVVVDTPEQLLAAIERIDA